MIKIYSKKQPTVLCHMIYTPGENNTKQRVDVAPEDQFIQVSHLNLKKDTTFKPHKHIWKAAPREFVIAQESWCVMKGLVLVHFFDIDGQPLSDMELPAGSISLTFQGGHTYTALRDSEVYEYKTGPYEGQEKDKVFI